MGLAEYRDKIFASFFSEFISPVYEQALGSTREKLFAQMSSQVSHFPDLRKKGSLRVIELGAGCGVNIKHLPSNIHLLALDINANFQNEYMENLEKDSGKGLIFEGYIVASATDMKEKVPDESVDVVVATSVGCMVDDVGKFYAEIQRILVPGGKFYYFEHIKANGWSGVIQKVARYSGFMTLYKGICGGCDYYRELDKMILSAGFSDVSQKYFYLELSKLNPFWSVGMAYLQMHVGGVATK